MQGLIQTFFGFITKLEENEIDYMVVGSMATMVYGEPRMTNDLDLVVQVSPQDASKFEVIFDEEQFYCPPIEVVRAEIVHRGQFNLIHHESGFKIDLVVRKDTKHAKSEFNRRRRVEFWQGSLVYVAAPEDIIIKKLEFFRLGGSEKHLKDIRGILAETNVDQKYLDEWIHKLGLEPAYGLIVAK